MRILDRLLVWFVTLLWGCWFLLVHWANYAETGTVLPPGPVDAHDGHDLLFWAALMAWTYATPFALLIAALNRRRWPNGPFVAAASAMLLLCLAIALFFL
jgi:hypothetical protein